MSAGRVRVRQRRRRSRGGSDVGRWLVRIALALAVFGLGVAFGKALDDGPRAGGPQTYVRTLRLPPTTGPVTTFTP